MQLGKIDKQIGLIVNPELIQVKITLDKKNSIKIGQSLFGTYLPGTGFRSIPEFTGVYRSLPKLTVRNRKFTVRNRKLTGFSR